MKASMSLSALLLSIFLVFSIFGYLFSNYVEFGVKLNATKGLDYEVIKFFNETRKESEKTMVQVQEASEKEAKSLFARARDILKEIFNAVLLVIGTPVQMTWNGIKAFITILNTGGSGIASRYFFISTVPFGILVTYILTKTSLAILDAIRKGRP